VPQTPAPCHALKRGAIEPVGPGNAEYCAGCDKSALRKAKQSNDNDNDNDNQQHSNTTGNTGPWIVAANASSGEVRCSITAVQLH